jgi:hypothetical protein
MCVHHVARVNRQSPSEQFEHTKRSKIPARIPRASRITVSATEGRKSRRAVQPPQNAELWPSRREVPAKTFLPLFSNLSFFLLSKLCHVAVLPCRWSLTQLRLSGYPPIRSIRRLSEQERDGALRNLFGLACRCYRYAEARCSYRSSALLRALFQVLVEFTSQSHYHVVRHMQGFQPTPVRLTDLC